MHPPAMVQMVRNYAKVNINYSTDYPSTGPGILNGTNEDGASTVCADVEPQNLVRVIIVYFNNSPTRTKYHEDL